MRPQRSAVPGLTGDHMHPFGSAWALITYRQNRKPPFLMM
jgi:hypothetical protein